ANGYGVGSRPRLQLRKQVADVRLHGLFRQEEPFADLAVHETLGDQLEDLDLALRRLLLELAQRRVERNDLRVGAGTPRRRLVETTRVVDVPAQDLLALCGVHWPD